MKKIIIITLLVAVLAIAYFTKPDDKTCKELAVQAVWGNVMPDKYRSPRFYGQFMDLYSNDITIDDWIFFKIIKYKMGDKTSTSIGAFKKVFFISMDTQKN